MDQMQEELGWRQRDTWRSRPFHKDAFDFEEVVVIDIEVVDIEAVVVDVVDVVEVEVVVDSCIEGEVVQLKKKEEEEELSVVVVVVAGKK